MNSTIISTTNPYPFNRPYYHYHKKPEFKKQLSMAFAHSFATGNNEILKLDNCKVARELNNKHSIQKIFSIYWSDFYDKFKHRIKRDSIVENVNKMIGCKDFRNGYLFYECPNCDNYHITGFTCKSRFCPTCGKKYADARSTAIAEKCINIPHRHMVFTIPFELRDYFQRNRELIDSLFNAVDDTFKYISFKMGRKKEYRFGFVSTLHTFGRALNFIPHLHVLIAEGVYDKDNFFKKASYFNYELLRKTFQRCLLDRIHKVLGDSFRKDKSKFYRKYRHGFYVYAPRLQVNKCKGGLKELVKYITRYAGHPPMSESRIINVDYNLDQITYYYDPHEDDNEIEPSKLKGRQFVTEHIFDFIGKLIVHITDTSKHNVRYYGFYSNKTIIDSTKNVSKLFRKYDILNMKKLQCYSYRLLKSYDYEIYRCYCGHMMTLNLESSYFP
jgi:hypothetical protein